jgi:hypothetical protein
MNFTKKRLFVESAQVVFNRKPEIICDIDFVDDLISDPEFDKTRIDKIDLKEYFDSTSYMVE